METLIPVGAQLLYCLGLGLCVCGGCNGSNVLCLVELMQCESQCLGWAVPREATISSSLIRWTGCHGPALLLLLPNVSAGGTEPIIAGPPAS